MQCSKVIMLQIGRNAVKLSVGPSQAWPTRHKDGIGQMRERMVVIEGCWKWKDVEEGKVRTRKTRTRKMTSLLPETQKSKLTLMKQYSPQSYELQSPSTRWKGFSTFYSENIFIDTNRIIPG